MDDLIHLRFTIYDLEIMRSGAAGKRSESDAEF